MLGLPAFGVIGFGFGVPCWCGVGGPQPGVSALLASWFVHWVSIRSREKRDLCGPQNTAHWGTKISGDRPRGLSAQWVSNDLATCGPVQDALEQGILD